MPEFTLTAATLKKTFTTANGQFNVYEVELQDHNGETTVAEMNTKSSSPAPPAGPISGTLENTQFGWKFKKEFVPKANGFGGRAQDPDTQAKIVRQHSQTVAVAIFVARGRTDFTFEDFEKLCDALDRDVARGVERSKA